MVLVAPQTHFPQMLFAPLATKIPPEGVDSVTIPGAIDAFCRLSKDYGAIGLAASLAPAIYYATAGVPIAPRVALDWGIAKSRLQGDAKRFYLLNGAAPKVGQIFHASKQAEVLKNIARQGRNGFYEGEVAQDMVASLNALGGVHTLDDFANTQSEYTTPVSGEYKGTELVEHPPNGQCATAILMNNMLAQFDIANMDPLGAERAHIEAEVTKLAYDARDRIIADPDQTTRLEHMLSQDTANALAQLVDPKRAMVSAAKISENVHKDTIYITVVDKDQMSVSLIYSIYNSFGSGLASAKFGISFQNRGSGFTLEKGHPNEAIGGQRPMHTIIPGMLRKNGKVIMPFGVMGGAYQPCGHTRFMSNMQDFGMDAQTAMDAPRCFAYEGELRVERGYNDTVGAELTEMGHKIEIPMVPIGGAQSILINHETGVLEGASDARKDGCALGY